MQGRRSVESDEPMTRIAVTAGPSVIAGLGVVLGVLGAAGARGEGAAPAHTGAFFESLGSNGRSCASCHDPAEGWTVTPRGLQERFDASAGLDPVFWPIDAANCPGVDVSTVEVRRQAYSLLLARGLIRETRPVPVGAEFTVLTVDNPYGCAGREGLSVYRRPLPVTNYDVLATVMWDGRHSVAGRGIDDDLAAQAADAAQAHLATLFPPMPAQIREIIAVQRDLAGRRDPALAPVEPAVPAAVRRGQGTFKTRVMLVTGVAGFNDDRERRFIAGCATCHDAPGTGSRTAAALLNIGVNDPSRRTPDLPLFTLRCTLTGTIVQTLDPGRALVSGKCRDIGKVKEPVLRGLAGRGPYFHNGSAATLMDVVEFYNARFQMRLSPGEKADLVAFLSTL
jgi:cytochrome c peroxidase